ncbi:mannitol dehydrogenase family protein [Octadecabacter sp. CECT 8868]|uniref:mannitol dehydrogenase family protein n=1 Tax=Octadecabacter algicola TaxID=2909342 RepID=UPI001F429557|nr:mannitol dehydrogenase family protein [Octadecabacter algicola]MCF2904230.1 mannitol dehydrogenase family protein [Octadecabacter algicola]
MTAPRLKRPDTPRTATGIVHLGLGAFFRAFGCSYVMDAMTAGGGDWGIVGVSLRSPDTRDALRDQDWAYRAVSLGAEGESSRIIDVLNDVLVAPENPQAVLDAMVSEGVQIVSLTVTEKGYCHHPASGKLNHDHPDIVHDLAHDLPRSTIGYLVRALAARRAAGTRPFTVLTCDNLPQNGQLLRGLVLEFAELLDPDLASWIASEARFPSTMVDRITPATTDADIARLTDAEGTYDAAPVLHEPFSQWVVEDDFVDDARPDLGAAGVQLVRDVEPFEDMKLRMLNGTHSALAYTAYLAGHETISDTVADPVFATYVRALWGEIVPNVAAPDGVDLAGYSDALFDRYANQNIRHKTWQIAMDGSQKLPQRMFGTLRETYQAGRSAPMLTLAVAAWIKYVGGMDETGAPIDVRDPLADKLRDVLDAALSPADKVAAVLAIREIVPADLAPRLSPPVTAAAQDVWALGTRAAIEKALG